MTSLRSIGLTLATLTILACACSSDSSPSSGTGGTVGTGGTSSHEGTGGAKEGSGGTNSSGGASSQGGTLGSGGSTLPGTGGASGTGGRTSAGSGGAGTGGRQGSGGTAAGGASTSTGGSTRTGSGGSGALGGATSAGSGGSTKAGSGGATGSGSGGTTGPGAGGSTGSSGADGGAAQSAGCGKTPTLKNGTASPNSITSGGASRSYYLRLPDSYDNSHPYRLVVAFAESGASALTVAGNGVNQHNYFTFASLGSKDTILAAPDAVGSAGSWSKTDVQLTDAILAQLEADLCIDTTRIFATGFSFGGAMSIALACTRADVFRAVAFFSGADLTGSCPTTLTKPIAYWASQASQDSTGTPSPTSGRTIQKLAAAVNGCTADPNAINFPAAGQPHTCTNYKNCSAGHPTIYCVFDGVHGWEPRDPGQSTSWAPKEAWAFITQF
jgi:poly(3-hydroxybutyrate) depolymerase